jgi:hypothetical protein
LEENIASSSPAIADYSLGKKQEPRADLKIGALRIVQIDVEANLVALQAETDHAAKLHKIIGFADGKDRGSDQAGQNCGGTLFVFAGNEKEMTATGIILFLKTANLQRTRSDLFALNGIFENVTQSVFSRGTQDQGMILGAKSVRRPIHELREMENEGCFQLILGRIELCARAIRGEQLKEQKTWCKEGSRDATMSARTMISQKRRSRRLAKVAIGCGQCGQVALRVKNAR